MARGSTQTAVQEAAQALFCAIADYLGEAESKKAFDLKVYPTYDDLISAYSPPGNKGINAIINEAYKNHIEIQSESLKSIETFLRKEEWYRSSVNIALALIKELHGIHGEFRKIKPMKWQDIFYAKGDKQIMEGIADLFKTANDMIKKDKLKNTIPFGNLNKWNPADMYFATDDAAKKIAAQRKNKIEMGFSELNNFIFEMMKEGELLPLSLKKSPDKAKVYKVNYKRSEEEAKLAEIQFIKIASESKKGERSLTLIINNSGGKFIMRHDPSTNAYKGEILLKSSMGGSVSGEALIEVMKMVDKTFANKFEDAYFDTRDKYKIKVKKLEKEVPKSTQRKKFDIIRTKYSTEVSNVLNGVWVDYLKKTPKAKSSQLIRFIVEYAGSMTINSSKFVVAK